MVTASDGLAAHDVTRGVAIRVANRPELQDQFTSGPSATTAENVSTTTPVYTAHAIRGFAGSPRRPAIHYSLAAGTGDNDLFAIDATTGAVTFKASPDYENPQDLGHDNVYDIVVTASNGFHRFDGTRHVAITVTNVDDSAPLITSGTTGAEAENTAVSNVVYTAHATSTDAGSAPITYSLGGADAGQFNIDGSSGAVTFKASPDYEHPADAGGNNTYDISVHANDGTYDVIQAVAISVTDVNDNAPIINSGATGTTAENVSTATAVYTAQATDADGTSPNNIVHYSLSGADAGQFNIDGVSGAVTFKASPDYEHPTDAGHDNTYNVVVNATDGGNPALSAMKAVAISVTDVNDNAPIITSGATGTTAENVSTATAVYTAQATDADGTSPNNIVHYSLSGTDAAQFNIDTSSGAVTFKASPDYEHPTDAGGNNTYDVVVTATDGGNPALLSSQAVAISVTNVNEAPTANPDAYTTKEDAALTVPVATGVLGNDTDPEHDTLSAVVDNGPAHGTLTLNPNGSFTYSPNADYNGTDSFTYKASDGSLTSAATTVTLNITSVNDAPAGTDTTVTALEDTAYAFTAADFGFTDPNDNPANALQGVKIGSLPSAGTLSYNGTAITVLQVTAGFEVSAADIAAGKLTFQAAANANGTGYASFTFQVRDDGGTADGGVDLDPSPNTLTIDVTAVNDAPVLAGIGLAHAASTEQVFARLDSGVTVSDVELDALNGGNGDYAGAYAYVTRATGGFASPTSDDEFAIDIAGASFTYTPTGAAMGDLSVGGMTFASFNGTGGTGSFNFNAGATTALVNEALERLTYRNANDDPPASLTLAYTFVDGNMGAQGLGGSRGDTQFLTVDIAAVNDAPANTVPGAQTVNEDTDLVFSAATMNAISIADADADGGDETVTLTVGQGTLALGSTAGLTVTSNGTASVTLTGTVADINAGLNGLTYKGTQDFNGNDTLSVFTSDNGNTGSGGAQTASSSVGITVSPVNDAPIVTSGHTQSFIENQAATAIDPTITVLDVDNANLASATVKITVNYVNGEDVLGFTNQNGITGSFIAATGTLTLTGTSSVANYQTALASVTYINTSDNPSGATRTISFIANDGTSDSAAATSTITITPVNDPPVLHNVAATASYAGHGSPTTLSAALTITDPDNTQLASARVSIGGGLGPDTLSVGLPTTNGVVDGTAISVAFDSDNGILLLSGIDSVANYEHVLDNVQYSTVLPNSTVQTTSHRSLTWSVNDGTVDSAPGSTDLTVINPADGNSAPVLAGGPFAPLYIGGAPAVTVAAGLTVTDANGTTLDSLVVTIDTGTSPGGDLLSINLPSTGGVIDGTAISVSYDSDNGILRLTGTDTLANYQDAIDHLQYASMQADVSFSGGYPTRTLSFVANDGMDDSTPLDVVLRVDDAPGLTTSSGNTAYSENGAAVVIDGGVAVADADDTNLASARVSITSGFQAGDSLQFVNTGTIHGTYAPGTGVLTLTGVDTTANYQAALQSIKFVSSNDDPSTNKIIGFSVNDGDTDSLVGSKTVQVTAINDAPTATSLTQSLIIAEDAAATTLFTTAPVVSDIDSPTVNATLTIAAAAGVLDGAGSATVSGSNLIYTISGTPTAVTTLLAGVTYDSAQDFNGSASVGVTIDDGPTQGPQGTNPAGTVSITVNPVNDAPTATSLTQSLTIAEDAAATTLFTTAPVVSDIDSPSVTATLTIAASAGVLGGAGSATVSGSNLIYTISGAPTTVTTKLAAVTYDSAQDFNGSASVGVTIDDGPTQGPQGTNPAGTVSITVTSVNDAPMGVDKTITGVGPHTFSVGDFGFTDPNDTPANALQAVEITTLPTTGALMDGATAVTAGMFIPVADINGGQLVFTPSGNSNASFTFQVQDDGSTSNGGVDTDPTPRTITLNQAALQVDLDGNDSSQVSGADYATTFTEQGAAVAIADTDTTVTNAGNPAAAATSATIVLTNAQAGDSLAINGGLPAGISSSITAGAGTITVTLSGTASYTSYQTALHQVIFATTGDAPNTTDRLLQVSLTDATGSSNQANSTIHVTAVNDAPVLANSSGAVTYVENASAIGLLAAGSVSDADNPANFSGGGFTVTISAGAVSGDQIVLLSSTPFAVSGSSLLYNGDVVGTVSGLGTTTVTVTGLTSAATPTVVNKLVEAFGFQSSSDDPGSGDRTAQFTFNDGGNTGTGGAQNSNTLSQTVHITAVNDAPVNTVPTGTQATNQNTNLVFNTANGNAITISDVDAEGGTETVTIAVSHGTLSLGATTGLSSVTNNAATISFTGTLANINADLNGLAYHPTNGYTGSDTLTITTNDNGHTPGPAGSDTDTVALNVTAPATIDGQLWYVTGTSFQPIAGHINSDGSAPVQVKDFIVGSDAQGHSISQFAADIDADPAAGYYFVIDAATGPASGTASSDPTASGLIAYRISDNSQVGFVKIGDTADQDEVQALAVDPVNHIVYVAQWGASPAVSGIKKISYNPSTGVLTDNGFAISGTTASAAAVDDIRSISIDVAAQKVYYSTTDNAYTGAGFAASNAVWVGDLATGTATQLTSTADFPATGTQSGYTHGNIGGVAVDSADGLVYFIVKYSQTASDNGLWYVNTTGANQTAHKVSGVTFKGSEDDGLSFDPQTRSLYISNATQAAQDSDPNVAGIIIAKLSADGHSVVSTQTISEATLTGTTPGGFEFPLGSSFFNLPVLTVAGSATFSSGTPTTLSSGATVTDADSGYFKGGTVQTSGGFSGDGDTLTFTNAGTSITGSVVNTNGNLTLTLSGYDTVAHYQQVLRSVTFNSGANPTNGGANLTRTVQWSVDDGEQNIPTGQQNSATSTINIGGAVINGPLALDLDGNNSSGAVGNNYQAGYSATGPFVAIADIDTSITDPGHTNLSSAVVTLTNAKPNDVLAISGALPSGITSAISSGAGTITVTLSGTASFASYQSALHEVVFASGNNNPDTSDRTITVKVNDGTSDSNIATTTIHVGPNTAPVANGDSVSATEAGGLNNATPGINPSGNVITGTGAAGAVGDTDGQDPSSALTVVAVHTGASGGTAGTLGSALIGTYGALTLNADGSYSYAVDNTNAIVQALLPASAAITDAFNYTIQDTGGLQSTATLTVSIHGANDLPKANADTGAMSEDDAPTSFAVLPNDTLDPDTGASNTITTGAVIVSGPAGTAFVNGDATASLAAGNTQIQVTLGAAFQQLHAGETATVTVPYTLTGNAGETSTANLVVTVNGANDVPVAQDDTPAAITEDQSGTAFTVLTNDTPDPDHGAPNSVTAGTPSIADAPANEGIDASDVTVSVNGSKQIVVTLGSDFQHMQDGEVAHVDIPYTLQGDQAGDTASATLHLTINGANDAPVIDLDSIAGGVQSTGTTAAFVENGAALAITPNLSLSDVDSANLTGATVSLSNPQTADVLTVSGQTSGTLTSGIGFSISGSKVTFTGTHTVADYQSALQSVQFQNTSDDPSAANRSFAIQVDDGAATNHLGNATATVTVQAVDDAPVNTIPADAAVPTAFSNTNTAISGISVADVDAESGLITTTLSVAHGTVAVSLAGGATVSAGASGSSTVTVSGTVAAINATLASNVTYRSTDGYTGQDNLTVATNDQGHTGTGGPLTTTSTVHIGVVPQVFYIDNTGGGSGGTGTAADPFKRIADFNASAATGTGDYVLLKNGSGNYSEADGINLKSGETLLGGNQNLSFTNLVTGATVGVQTASGSASKITVTGANDGVDLSTNNTVKGLAIDTSTGAASGVGIHDVVGGVGTLALDGITIKTASGTGLLLTTGGTVTATGTNSITSTTGTALDIENTNIGSGNVTFHDISSNGAASGIVLNNTGSAGGLKVTGDGNTSVGGNNSGGTIQNTTGAGISLTSTSGASFTDVHVTKTSGNGIGGTTVNGFTLANSTVDGANGGSAVNQGSVYFTNLTGTANITNSVVKGGHQDNVSIQDSSGTLNLTISGTTIRDTDTGTNGNDNLFIQANGTSTVTAHVTGNTFAATNGDHLQTVGDDNATLNIIVTGNTFSGGGGTNALGQGITISGGHSSPSNSTEHVNFNISNNTLTGTIQGGAINVNEGAGAGTWQGQVSNNTIGTPAVANSGASQSSGIRAENHSGAGTLTVLIDSNKIYQWNNGAGINLQDGEPDNGTAVLNATVTNNVLANPGPLSQHGIVANIGAATHSQNNVAHLNIHDNNVDLGATPPNSGSDVRVRSRNGATVDLDGYGGTNQDTAAVISYLAGRNPLANTNITASVSGENVGATAVQANQGFHNGTTPLPIVPLQMFAPGGVQASSPTPGETHLTQAELNPVIAAAIANWAAAGASASQLAALHAATFSIGTLSSDVLGVEGSGAIQISSDAAGHGWFVDPTPGDNFEFTHAVNAAGTDLLTDPSQAAAGHVDLLSVVTHELGHVLGLGDGLSASDANDLMYIGLANGERRLPDAADVAQAAGDRSVAMGHDATVRNHFAGDTAFVFSPGFGHDTIRGFTTGGAHHDTLSLPSTDFATFVDVLHHTQNTAAGAVIHDPKGGDTLLLANVSKMELARHKADFTFHA